MAKQRTALIKSVEIAVGTKAFHFVKPEGFRYKAGQTINITLIDPPETDAEGNTRTFSVASAPHEGDLMIATRMRDTAFKRSLGSMVPGTEVEFEGPFGSYTLHNDAKKPAVFLTGGIGVTPVRAILLDAKERALTHRIYVFYSNRRPEDAAFLQELEALAREMPNLTLVPTMTGMEASKMPWSGKTGYIDAEMIEHIVKEPTEAVYYLDGPLTMVSAMHKALKELSVDDDNIRTEEFPGY